MNRQTGKRVLALCSVSAGLCLLMPGTVVQADWKDWWSTPEQQAEVALQSGDIATLKSVAPDTLWEGVAEYKNGEFDAAAKSFDRELIKQRANGQLQAANRALYNRGVSEVLNEQYENAVQTFNEVLESNPQFSDAQHNRDIAMQLIQQQEQEQEQQSREGDEQKSDESSESGDQSPSSSADSQAPQDGESGETSEQQDTQSGDAGEEAEADSEEQRRQDEQAAQDALEAEAQANGLEPSEQDDGATSEDDQRAAAPVEKPLSESEQATEQWLRRIPDDPAGLLRRKLLQSHQLEYPEVRDAQQPW